MKIYILGQISKDMIRFQSQKTKRIIGGSVYYSGLTLKILGADPVILTKLHSSDEKLLTPFKDHRVSYFWWDSHNTASFHNVYDISLKGD